MKRLLALIVTVMFVSGFAAAALAWEFEMTGSWENRLRYFARLGNNDLFGIASLQEGPAAGVIPPFIGFAGPSTWARGAVLPTNLDNATSQLAAAPGYLITRGGFSTWGSDAAIHDQKMTLIPTIKVNPAIRVHGVYTVGGYRNKYNQTSAGAVSGVGVPPFERWYMHDSSPNAAYNTAAIGSWEQIRATFHTPWATFSIGVKDFPLGVASNLGYNTRANAFLAVVPYGPFRFLGAIWLTDGLLESYPQSPDRVGNAAQNQLFQSYFVTYCNGPVEIGFGPIWQLRHQGEGGGPLPDRPGTSATIADVSLTDYQIYFKYFNGRFFANGEYAWNMINVHPVLLGTIGSVLLANSGSVETHTETYNVFLETGVVLGPSKISLLWVQSSGPVLNNGWFALAAVNPVTAGVLGVAGAGRNPKAYGIRAINYQALEPYEYLMFYTYAGGLQTFHADGTGQMADAYAFAARYDHAVASNLNIYGSYIWAHRLEKAGVWLGQFSTTGLNRTFLDVNALRAMYGRTSPFVEDGFIGWEANFGVDWKLLEGLTFKTRYSYWQPGDFFKEAWQAVGVFGGAVVPGTTGPGALYLSRDPIQCVQGSILIEF
ncbi:MAG: hypothetical protein LDL33_11050 [Desulfomonile sp.]|nr:hypothetical protein [Desulfomonile sp.]